LKGEDGGTGDTLYGLQYLRDIYTKAVPDVSGRVTVPVLWDKQRETIVSKKSSEIIRMFNSAFNGLTGNTLDFWPEAKRDKIEEVNARIYDTLNNGVYKSGFATTRAAYDAAVGPLFDTMDWLENPLSRQRYFAGDQITEADWRLFTTLVRFDAVYHGHFKCNGNKLVEFPNLWAYTRELYQVPDMGEKINMHHITRHYHYSHESVNPHRIVPIGPQPDWMEPHGREAMAKAAGAVAQDRDQTRPAWGFASALVVSHLAPGKSLGASA